MSTHTETETRLADEVQKMTATLDELPAALLAALLAASALQLARRHGPAAAARDLRELAATLAARRRTH